MYISKLNRSRILGGFFVLILFIVLAFSLGISQRDLLESRISISLLFSDLATSFLRVTIVAISAWLAVILGG